MNKRVRNGIDPCVYRNRRQWLLRAGALGSSVALTPWAPLVSAQSQSVLNVLPRVALVLGNSSYTESPLRNPGNDATAIAAELKKAGFTVDLRIDAGRDQMNQAIQSYGSALSKASGVGLFYYAGHGAQLEWRNYLIPVDASLNRLEDMRTNTVELNVLLRTLTQAKNAMNLVILDACRDNPFGNKVLTEQKGLTQFDAPPGSLIAYATSPGNTAGDGDGVNGLYTEHLLQELRVPGAKIEDVMKRVRLNVRRKSQGQQIPWESTSLEDDFYFLPPQDVKKRSEEEKDRQFAQQKGEWDRIKNSQNVDDFYGFLLRYPSGYITEQAMFRIEQLQRAKTTAQADKNGLIQKQNEERFRVGDECALQVTNSLTGKVLYRTTQRVERIDGGFVYVRSGNKGQIEVRTLDGGFVRGGAPEGYYSWDPPRIDLPGDRLDVGKRWTARTVETFEGTGKSYIRQDDAKIVSVEEVQVPFGKFLAYKVILDTVYSTGSRVKRTYWVEPGWGFFLKTIREVDRANSTVRETYEMISRKRGQS